MIITHHYHNINTHTHTHTLILIYPLTDAQPKEVKTLRNFLVIARRKDAQMIKIKKDKNKKTKFKVRTSKYLYTLVVEDEEKANKLVMSLPPGTFFIEFSSLPPLLLSREAVMSFLDRDK